MPEPSLNLSPETQRVIRLLRASGARCREVILHPPGGTENARNFESSRAAARLAGINRELDALKVVAARASTAEIGRQYQAGLQAAEKMAVAAGVGPKPGSVVSGSFTQVDRSQAEVLSRQTAGDLGKAVDSMKRVTGRTVRQVHALGLNDAKVNRILAGGTIDGVPQQTLEALRKQMRKVAIDGFVEVPTRTGGVITFKPDAYADLVFQTKSREAASLATQERLKQRGMDLVKIIGSNSINFCTQFVGKVFSLSGTSQKYPALRSLPSGGPPFHPRCSKTLVAFVELLARPGEIDKALPNEDTRALEGKSPAEAQRIYKAAS